MSKRQAIGTCFATPSATGGRDSSDDNCLGEPSGDDLSYFPVRRSKSLLQTPRPNPHRFGGRAPAPGPKEIIDSQRLVDEGTQEAPSRYILKPIMVSKERGGRSS